MAKRDRNTDRLPSHPAPIPRSPRKDGVALATLGGVIVLLVISFANWRSFGRLSSRLDKLETQMAQVAERTNRPPAAPQRQGPDPARVYPIKTADAPLRGSAGAVVTIAEFSDFQ